MDIPPHAALGPQPLVVITPESAGLVATGLKDALEREGWRAVVSSDIAAYSASATACVVMLSPGTASDPAVTTAMDEHTNFATLIPVLIEPMPLPFARWKVAPILLGALVAEQQMAISTLLQALGSAGLGSVRPPTAPSSPSTGPAPQAAPLPVPPTQFPMPPARPYAPPASPPAVAGATRASGSRVPGGRSPYLRTLIIVLVIAVIGGGGYLFLHRQSASGNKQVGDEVSLSFQDTTGKISCKVVSASLYSGGSLRPDPGFVFVIVHVQIATVEPVPTDLFYDVSDFAAATPDGRTVSAVSAPDGGIDRGGLGHGWPNTVDGNIAIQAPQGKGFTLLWHPNAPVLGQSDGYHEGPFKWDIPAVS